MELFEIFEVNDIGVVLPDSCLDLDCCCKAVKMSLWLTGLTWPESLDQSWPEHEFGLDQTLALEQN